MTWLRTLLQHPRAVILAVAAVTLAFGGVAAVGLGIDNTIGVWLPPDDPQLARYEEFRSVFGEDNFVIVAVEGQDLRTDPERAGVVALELRLAGIEGVERVLGPGTSGDDASEALLSADGRAAGILVHPDTALDHAERGRLLARIEHALVDAGFEDRVHVAGPEAINQVLDSGSQASFGLLFPIVVLLVGATLWALLRDPRPVIGILLVAAVASAWTLGLLAATGHSLNMVVASLPSLLLVLGTAYSLHLVNAFGAAEGATHAERWGLAAAEVLRPCAFTAGTTAAGLGALAFADIPPVRDLGIFAALGTIVSFALVFSLLPALLQVTGYGGRRTTVAHWGPALAARIQRHRRPILGVAGVVLIASIGGISRLSVQSHILSFFPPSHPLVRSTAWIEERLFGLTPIEIRFSGPLTSFLAPGTADAARTLAAEIAAEPDVTAVLGPLAGGGPSGSPLPVSLSLVLSQGVLSPGALAATSDRLRIAGEQADARWTVAARTTPIEESAALVSRIEEAVTRHAPAGLHVEVTGAIPILVRMQALLLTAQIRTFGASILVVTLLLVAAFRSLGLALLSLVPNLLPVTATLGMMGFLGIALDVATVTVAGIALGLVVDDTIHFLDRWRRTPARAGARDRLGRVFLHCGRPILFTSLATAIGFAAFAFAPFRPTLFFGLLIAATALFALVCDLLVLPALLLARP